MPSKALEIGVCLHRCHAFGEHGERLLSRVFDRRKKFSLLGKFYEEL
jgi:hypothetical protein